jgi:hypothetical protein
MIARVFPRRTAATPSDAYAFVGDPPLFLPADITEVHVSVTFTWDRVEGERVARPHHALRCYVLVGYPGDKQKSAEERLRATLSAGFVPMAMLWRDADGRKPPEWHQFIRRWIRPGMIAGHMAMRRVQGQGRQLVLGRGGA